MTTAAKEAKGEGYRVPVKYSPRRRSVHLGHRVQRWGLEAQTNLSAIIWGAADRRAKE